MLVQLIQRLADDCDKPMSNDQAQTEFTYLQHHLINRTPLAGICLMSSYGGIIWNKQLLVDRLKNRAGLDKQKSRSANLQHTSWLLTQLECLNGPDVVFDGQNTSPITAISIHQLAYATLNKLNSFYTKSAPQDMQNLQFRLGTRKYDKIVMIIQNVLRKKKSR